MSAIASISKIRMPFGAVWHVEREDGSRTTYRVDKEPGIRGSERWILRLDGVRVASSSTLAGLERSLRA